MMSQQEFLILIRDKLVLLRHDVTDDPGIGSLIGLITQQLQTLATPERDLLLDMRIRVMNLMADVVIQVPLVEIEIMINSRLGQLP